MFICDFLRDLVPFVQFEKPEACSIARSDTSPFLRFLKLYKWYQIAQNV